MKRGDFSPYLRAIAVNSNEKRTIFLFLRTIILILKSDDFPVMTKGYCR
jgi:hypothetical protein